MKKGFRGIPWWALSEEHKKKAIERISVSHLREKNPNWKGKNIIKATGGDRARRWHPNPKSCQLCGNLKTEIHHIDNNPLNNTQQNIMWLCRKHHMEIDGRLTEAIARVKKMGMHRDSKGRVLSPKQVKVECPSCGAEILCRIQGRVEANFFVCGNCGVVVYRPKQK